MTLKVYLDFMSQPSRALYIFLKLTKIPFELCTVALRKGEHMTEEFKETHSRFQKVPFIHDGDFRLNESIAIVRYLTREHNLDNQWYPRDSKRQARVDEYLEWQHNNTRAFMATYFQKKWLIPMVTGITPDPKQIENHKNNMLSCLDQIENLWLANTPYIAGDQISVADIFAASEIEQPRMAGFEPREGRPVLSAWLERVRVEAGPFYDEAHVVLNKIAQKTKEQQLKKAKI